MRDKPNRPRRKWGHKKRRYTRLPFHTTPQPNACVADCILNVYSSVASKGEEDVGTLAILDALLRLVEHVASQLSRTDNEINDTNKNVAFVSKNLRQFIVSTLHSTIKTRNGRDGGIVCLKVR